MSWALSIPDDGKVIACDISSDYANIGKPFWKEAGVDHKIDLRIGEAAKTLRKFYFRKTFKVEITDSFIITFLNILRF